MTTPINNNTNQTTTSDHHGAINFTHPWGAWGCIWRFLIFLFGILLFVFILWSMRQCNKKEAHSLFDPYIQPDSTVYPIENVDTAVAINWPDTISGVPELPSPEDNYLPPVDTTRFVTNPEDSLSMMMDGQVFVLFNSQDIKADMASFAQQFKNVYPGPDYSISYYNPASGTMLLDVPIGKVVETCDELPQRIPDIDFMAFTNDIWTDQGVPSDPDFRDSSYDEYFKLTQAYDAWDITQGDKNVKVAIVDTYFDLTNPEIGERYENPYNVFTETTDVAPPKKAINDIETAADYAHGTHVAGIAIGGRDNGVGCSGIAPKCSWIPISIGDFMCDITLTEGIMYAVYHGADVVNFSVGKHFVPNIDKLLPLSKQVSIATTPHKKDKLWDYILKVADSHKCVLVTSAGNENILMGMDEKNRGRLMLTVENVNSKGIKAESSCFGNVASANVNFSKVAAPGENIWSSSYKPSLPIFAAPPYNYKVSKNKGLQEMSGTSMASPYVAGAVALMKSQKKELSISEVIKILQSTGKQTDKSGKIGPTIQIRNALNMVSGKKMKYDDVKDNHKNIVGKWKSTHTLYRTNGEDSQTIEEIWTYFIFSSPDEGRLEHHGVITNIVFSADIVVNWNKDNIEIVQIGAAKSDSDDNLIRDYQFICTPDANGYLEAVCQENNTPLFTFYLEKVK